MKKTTPEFEIKVDLRCGDNIYKQWLPLKDLKDLNPVNVAEFSKSRGLDCEPAFFWWVSYVLFKRDLIICSIVTRLCCTTNKY